MKIGSVAGGGRGVASVSPEPPLPRRWVTITRPTQQRVERSGRYGFGAHEILVSRTEERPYGPLADALRQYSRIVDVAACRADLAVSVGTVRCHARAGTRTRTP